MTDPAIGKSVEPAQAIGSARKEIKDLQATIARVTALEGRWLDAAAFRRRCADDEADSDVAAAHRNWEFAYEVVAQQLSTALQGATTEETKDVLPRSVEPVTAPSSVSTHPPTGKA